jgi:hypothetical protein
MTQDDWVYGLFQSERTRGLSGPMRPALALDANNPFYNFRLWRHACVGSFLDESLLLWKHSGVGGGLAPHLEEPSSPPDAHVLLILSQEDFEEAQAQGDWLTAATQAIGEERTRDTGCSAPVHLLCDGDTHSQLPNFGLQPGEFITTCLPNTFVPQEDSKVGWSIYMNRPSQEDDFRKVGSMHRGQRMLTVGNHWLDNVQDPSFPEPALYRLVQDENGQVVHLLAPDLDHLYQVSTEARDGHEVVTVATIEGEPVAHLLIIGHESTESVTPESHNRQFLTLRETGVLLQKVHFARFMTGYNVYLRRDGTVSTYADNPLLTIEVRRRSVQVVPHEEGASLGSIPLAVGEPYALSGPGRVKVGGQTLNLADLQQHRGRTGWPYVAEVHQAPSSFYLDWGETHCIGRTPGSRITLPDQADNDNIVWKPEVGDGATILMRTGDVPKSRFYTDSIMVASEHATVVFVDNKPVLKCTARHCFTFVRRDGEIYTLHPTTSKEEPKALSLLAGDEILIGNSLFEVQYGHQSPPHTPIVPASVRFAEGNDPTPDAEPMTTGPDDPAEPPPAPAPPDLRIYSGGAVSSPDATFVFERIDGESLANLDEPMHSISDAPLPPNLRASNNLNPASIPGQHLAGGDISSRAEADATFELGQHLRLEHIGWSVRGDVTCGNHAEADLILPEHQVEQGQRFVRRNYFSLTGQGAGMQLHIHSPNELLIDGEDPAHEIYTDLLDRAIFVIRRDANGDEDFAIELCLTSESRLPDPDAMLFAIDTEAGFAGALFGYGIPDGSKRSVALNDMTLTLSADGDVVHLSDYLESYQNGIDPETFYVQQDDQPFVEAPRDGRDLTLQPGDRLLIGTSVYELVTNE